MRSIAEIDRDHEGMNKACLNRSHGCTYPACTCDRAKREVPNVRGIPLEDGSGSAVPSGVPSIGEDHGAKINAALALLASLPEAPAVEDHNLSEERRKAHRMGYLEGLSASTARNLVALLNRGLKQLDQWQKKYGEHQPEWLPPAGDVRWAEDVAEALAERAPPAAPQAVPPQAEMTDAEIAPWTDFAGNKIRHGDRLKHPDGTEFIAIKLSGFTEDGDAWRAVYGAGSVPSRLSLQIGEKGRAILSAARLKGETP